MADIVEYLRRQLIGWRRSTGECRADSGGRSLPVLKTRRGLYLQGFVLQNQMLVDVSIPARPHHRVIRCKAWPATPLLDAPR